MNKRGIGLLIIGLIVLGVGRVVFFDTYGSPQSDAENNFPKELAYVDQLLENLSAHIKKIPPSPIVIGDEDSLDQDKQVLAPERIPQVIPGTTGLPITVANITYLTNQERIKQGLIPLRSVERLNRSAAKKSADMFAYDYFAHNSPQRPERDFSYFINNESYDFIRISENLAMGDFTTAEEVVTAWMKSPNHRANILYSNYQHIGVSVQQGYLNGQLTRIMVQHFGIPKNACIEVNQKTLDQLKIIESEALEIRKLTLEMEQAIVNDDTQMTDGELTNLINQYNLLIRTYNDLVKEFATISESYNADLEKYNTCIRELNDIE